MLHALSLLIMLGGRLTPESRPIDLDPREVNLANARQLTFGGQNAEAYWNREGTKLIYQSRQPGYPDEQIFTMNADGSGKRLVSTGKGRSTCGYFLPDGSGLLFSSTHATEPGPQPPVDMSKGYVWMVNPAFRIYTSRWNQTSLKSVFDRPGYAAETTIAPNGKFMTFTATWSGDLEIYRSRLDGSDLHRLTSEEGYDGGPFVSWDSKKIVYRRDSAGPEALPLYRELLSKNLVRPGKLEIWIMNADGTGKRQVTRLGGASFAPFLHPSGKYIIFSSNFEDPKGREFDLYTIDVDGSNLRRITYTPEFDGFPMFTRDGRWLVWASNRNGSAPRETNLFVARWRN